MADSRSGIVPLSGSNYPTWKLQCRMALLKQGVWKIVDGTEVCPDENDQPGNYRKFCERRDRALSTIVLAVETSLLYLLGDPQDPMEVWNKLCDQFQKKTWANKLTLRRRLYSLKLKDGEPVQGHIKQIVEIFEELAVIGQPIEEEDRVVHILSSLPESFNMLVTALEASPEVPSLELVTERLLHDERKRKEKLEERNNLNGGNSHDALFVGGQRSRSGGPICFYCGERGHVKRICPELRKKNEELRKKDEEDKEKKGPEIASFSRVDSDFDDIECIALVSEVETKDKSWIVDSASSNHLCNDKNKMSDFKKLKYPEHVRVGNGELMVARYEGCVKLLVKTGRITRKVKLHNVLYVPELKYNLLSVSKSAEKGKKVEFVKSGCKIVDIATGKTVATATKKGQLYYLDSLRYGVNYNQNNQYKKESQRQEMKKALLSVRENNFQEEMLKRLNSIEEDKLKMEKRLNEFERQEKDKESYLFKEEKSHNRVEELRRVQTKQMQ